MLLFFATIEVIENEYFIKSITSGRCFFTKPEIKSTLYQY